jgi:peptidoglycan/xylan/chitin deacetylase (PgdA/CDA1 family)
MKLGTLNRLNSFNSFGGQSRSSYWNPLKKLNGELVNFWSKLRSGLSLVDDYGNNATILPQVANFTSATTVYLSLSKITVNEGEIEIHFLHSAVYDNPGPILGYSGAYYISVSHTNKVLVSMVGTGQWKYFVCANISSTEINRIKLIIRIDAGVTKIRIICNDVESSTPETAFSDTRPFVIDYIGKAIVEQPNYLISYVNVISSGVNVLKMFLMGQYMSPTTNYEIDCSGANNKGTYVGTPIKAFSKSGNTYLMDSGYSIYNLAENPDIIIPYGGSANPLTVLNYTLKETLSGSLTKLNNAPALIEFTNDLMDRSNATVWGDLARGGFYDATSSATKKRWHTSELNQDNFRIWLQPAYREIVFTKFENNNVGSGRMLQEVFMFPNVKVGSNLNSVLKYSKFIYNRFNKGKIVFGVDGSTIPINNALPIFVSKGVKATIYAIPEQLTAAGNMEWNDLENWRSAGMDIQDHQLNDNLGLTFNQVVAIYQDIDNQFTSNGFDKPEHTAYLGGMYDANVLAAVSIMRKTGRTANGGNTPYNEYRKANKQVLMSNNIGKTWSMTLIKSQMDTALAERSAFMTYFHGIAAPGVDNGLTQAELEEIIDYANAIGLDIVTHSELYQLLV